MRDNKVNVLKKMLGMILVAPVMLSLSLFAADPVHLWELDENDTSAIYEDTGSSLVDANGSCASGGGNCPTPTVGRINGAQDFNASEPDRIDVTNTSNFDWAQDDNATITFWMMSEMAPDSNRAMIGRTSAGSILWYIGVDATGHVRVAVAKDKTQLGLAENYDSNSSVSEGNVTDGAWHHIAVVLTQPEIRVYVDGASDFNVPRSATSDLNVSAYVNFGSLSVGSGIPYNGALDDIALYNVALSASEIKANYDSIVSPPAPEPEPEPVPVPEPEPVPVPEPVPDTPIITDGGGGGCTYNPDSKNFDMMFLLMIALGLFYPFRRRFIK